MTIELRERATRHLEATNDPNVFRVRILSAGLGSSAYYPAEVVERDGPNVFVPGIFSFANHPTMDEAWAQPERDVTKIVGKQVSPSTYDPTDQSLYADFKFSEKFTKEVISEFGDVIGMSIYALGESEIGTIGEYTGSVLTKFVPDALTSVDAVTVAGANGAIITKVSEAYKSFGSRSTAEPQRTKEKEKNPMDEETFKRILAEALSTQAETIATKLSEALKPAPVDPETPDIAAVAEAVAKSELPEEGRKRVYEAIKVAGTKVEDVIASEKAYVEAVEKSVKERLAESTQSETFGGRISGDVVSGSSVLPKGW